MKKVLLAGTSFSAVPILSVLKQYGHEVCVAGALQGDPCHVLADFSLYFDYSDRSLLLEAVKSGKIDYLCPSCNDYSYLACSWVAEQLGLPGYDAYEITEILHLKGKFRNFCSCKGFPVPKAVSVHSVTCESYIPFAFPVLVKPVDSFSGRGLQKVDCYEEVVHAVDSAVGHSRRSEVLVEEFIEGSLHSHSGFIRDGRFVFDVIADEFCTVYQYQVNCSNIPSRLSCWMQDSVRDCMQQMVSELNLKDGLLHTQFMVRNDQFWIVECMRRAPGDLYYRMVELSTGINGMKFYVAPFVGQSMPEEFPEILMQPCARHTISVSRPLIASSVSVNLPSNGLELVMLKQSGNALKEAPFDKQGIFFMNVDSAESLFSITPRLADYVTVFAY